MRITSLDDMRVLARKTRREKGLSQEQAAGLIGHSRKWLSDFERGKSDPPTSMSIALLTLLGVPLETTGTPTEPSDAGDEIDLEEGL